MVIGSGRMGPHYLNNFCHLNGGSMGPLHRPLGPVWSCSDQTNKGVVGWVLVLNGLFLFTKLQLHLQSIIPGNM